MAAILGTSKGAVSPLADILGENEDMLHGARNPAAAFEDLPRNRKHFKTEFEYQQLITRAPTFEHLNWNINSSTPIVGSLGRPWLGLLLWRMSL